MWEVVIEPTRARCIFLQTDKEISEKRTFFILLVVTQKEERYWDGSYMVRWWLNIGNQCIFDKNWLGGIFDSDFVICVASSILKIVGDILLHPLPPFTSHHLIYTIPIQKVEQIAIKRSVLGLFWVILERGAEIK